MEESKLLTGWNLLKTTLCQRDKWIVSLSLDCYSCALLNLDDLSNAQSNNDIAGTCG